MITVAWRCLLPWWFAQKHKRRAIQYRIDENGCFIVTSHKAKRAGKYPMIWDGQRMTTIARFLWEKLNGPIPEGMDLCHSCDNPECINPDHLWLGTRADNIDDMWRKGRAGWQKKPWVFWRTKYADIMEQHYEQNGR